MLQAGRGVGKDSGLTVRHCRCAHHRPSRPSHRLQLQLLLPQGDRSGRHAVPEFQPRHKLPLSARYPWSVFH